MDGEDVGMEAVEDAVALEDLQDRPGLQAQEEVQAVWEEEAKEAQAVWEEEAKEVQAVWEEAKEVQAAWEEEAKEVQAVWEEEAKEAQAAWEEVKEVQAVWEEARVDHPRSRHHRSQPHLSPIPFQLLRPFLLCHPSRPHQSPTRRLNFWNNLEN